MFIVQKEKLIWIKPPLTKESAIFVNKGYKLTIAKRILLNHLFDVLRRSLPLLKAGTKG